MIFVVVGSRAIFTLSTNQPSNMDSRSDEKPKAAAAATEKKAATTVQGIADRCKDAAVLDLAFALDCTGSMTAWLDACKERLLEIVAEVCASSRCCCYK